MQMLTVDGVKAAARDYYEKGLLAAQNPNVAAGFCAYSYPGTKVRCAIGAALNDEAITAAVDRGYNGESVICLSGNPQIVDFEIDDESAITKIQNTHDQWLSGKATEDDFREVIGLSRRD